MKDITFLIVFVGLIAAAACEKKKACGEWERFTWTIGKQTAEVINNMWGINTATNPDKFQCVIWNDNSSLTFNYSWDGPTSQVKAYPSFVHGWHWGDMGSRYGLPRKIGDGYALETQVSFQHHGLRNDEIMNFAWDIWIADNNNMEWSQKQAVELMIWPWRLRQYPFGSKVTEAKIWGATWEVWYGTADWKVVTFVRKQNTLQVQGKLRDFFQWVVKNKNAWLRNDQWVIGVEFGCELIVAKGTSTFTSYKFQALTK